MACAYVILVAFSLFVSVLGQACKTTEECGEARFCSMPYGQCGGVGECISKTELCYHLYSPVCTQFLFVCWTLRFVDVMVLPMWTSALHEQTHHQFSLQNPVRVWLFTLLITSQSYDCRCWSMLFFRRLWRLRWHSKILPVSQWLPWSWILH